jgi:hypothetical protein
MSDVPTPCPICHESLLPKAWEALQAPIVQTVKGPDGCFVVTVHHQTQNKIGSTSCGHCFHTKCYERWQEESNSQANSQTICPLCHLPTERFTPIYNLSSHQTSTADGPKWLIRSRFEFMLAATLNNACSAFRQEWDELVSSFDVSVENPQTLPPAYRPILAGPLTQLKLDHREMTIRHLFDLSLWGSEVFMCQFEAWANWLILVQEQIDVRIRSVMGDDHEIATDGDDIIILDPFEKAARHALQELRVLDASVPAVKRHAFVQKQAVENVVRSFDSIRSTKIMTSATGYLYQLKSAYITKVYEYLKTYCRLQHEVASTDDSQDDHGGAIVPSDRAENDGQDAADAMPNEQEDTEDQEVVLQQGVPQGGHDVAVSFT